MQVYSPLLAMQKWKNFWKPESIFLIPMVSKYNLTWSHLVGNPDLD